MDNFCDTILMWLIVNGGDKVVGLCESDKQSLTVCHVRLVIKVVILEE